MKDDSITHISLVPIKNLFSLNQVCESLAQFLHKSLVYKELFKVTKQPTQKQVDAKSNEAFSMNEYNGMIHEIWESPMLDYKGLES